MFSSFPGTRITGLKESSGGDVANFDLETSDGRRYAVRVSPTHFSFRGDGPASLERNHFVMRIAGAERTLSDSVYELHNRYPELVREAVAADIWVQHGLGEEWTDSQLTITPDGNSATVSFPIQAGEGSAVVAEMERSKVGGDVTRELRLSEDDAAPRELRTVVEFGLTELINRTKPQGVEIMRTYLDHCWHLVRAQPAYTGQWPEFDDDADRYDWSDET
ncbi:MAG: hypothetical protein WKF57_06165 [Nakamurella sp.]